MAKDPLILQGRISRNMNREDIVDAQADRPRETVTSHWGTIKDMVCGTKVEAARLALYDFSRASHPEDKARHFADFRDCLGEAYKHRAVQTAGGERRIDYTLQLNDDKAPLVDCSQLSRDCHAADLEAVVKAIRAQLEHECTVSLPIPDAQDRRERVFDQQPGQTLEEHRERRAVVTATDEKIRDQYKAGLGGVLRPENVPPSREIPANAPCKSFMALFDSPEVDALTRLGQSMMKYDLKSGIRDFAALDGAQADEKAVAARLDGAQPDEKAVAAREKAEAARAKAEAARREAVWRFLEHATPAQHVLLADWVSEGALNAVAKLTGYDRAAGPAPGEKVRLRIEALPGRVYELQIHYARDGAEADGVVPYERACATVLIGEAHAVCTRVEVASGPEAKGPKPLPPRAAGAPLPINNEPPVRAQANGARAPQANAPQLDYRAVRADAHANDGRVLLTIPTFERAEAVARMHAANKKLGDTLDPISAELVHEFGDEARARTHAAQLVKRRLEQLRTEAAEFGLEALGIYLKKEKEQLVREKARRLAEKIQRANAALAALARRAATGEADAALAPALKTWRPSGRSHTINFVRAGEWRELEGAPQRQAGVLHPALPDPEHPGQRDEAAALQQQPALVQPQPQPDRLAGADALPEQPEQPAQ